MMSAATRILFRFSATTTVVLRTGNCASKRSGSESSEYGHVALRAANRDGGDASKLVRSTRASLKQSQTLDAWSRRLKAVSYTQRLPPRNPPQKSPDFSDRQIDLRTWVRGTEKIRKKRKKTRKRDDVAASSFLVLLVAILLHRSMSTHRRADAAPLAYWGFGQSRCLCRKPYVPTPLIVCGPSKNSISVRSEMPSLV